MCNFRTNYFFLLPLALACLWIVAYGVSTRVCLREPNAQCNAFHHRNSIINHRNGKKSTMTTFAEWQCRGIFILFHAHQLPTARTVKMYTVLVLCLWLTLFLIITTRFCVLCAKFGMCINSKLAIKTKNVIKFPSLITFIRYGIS